MLQVVLNLVQNTVGAAEPAASQPVNPAVIAALAVGGVVMAVGAVSAVIQYRKWKKAKSREDVIWEVTRGNAAAKEFSAHASLFVGLYEPLCLIRDGRLKHAYDVFADWGVRIGNLEDAESLHGFWNDWSAGFESWNEFWNVRKAKELLEFLSKAGVTRSADEEITVELQSFKYYSVQGGGKIEPGSKAKVITPYWGLDGVVLEKGLICKIDFEQNN